MMPDSQSNREPCFPARRIAPIRRAALITLFLHFAVTVVQGQDTTSIELRGLAAFRVGDDNTWRSMYIDERDGWNFVPVPGAWERAGFPLHDGTAWYRIRFRIPRQLRNDSLLLVMSEVDDADETFFNGMPIGKSGEFPPNAKSELHSLRIYPIPRSLREDYNVLAIRVCDLSDSGGITGEIFRIIRADSLHTVLNRIVDAPFRAPPLFLSNGIMVSAFNRETSTIEWTRPHVFEELESGRITEAILASVTLDVETENGMIPLRSLRMQEADYENGAGLVRTSYAEGLDVSWYHPFGTGSRILVILARIAAHARIGDVGLRFNITRQYWSVGQREEHDDVERRRYFILAYHSCCEDFSRRDLDAFLDARDSKGRPSYSLESQKALWDSVIAPGNYLPSLLREDEKRVYRRSSALLLAAQVREPGGGAGEIVSAFSPQSRAIASPRDHLLSCIALAKAGHAEAAREGIEFIRRAETGQYALFDVYGTEHGVGYPYLVTPAWYVGNGTEKTWPLPEQAVLSVDGFPLYIEAVEALRLAERRRVESSGRRFQDSTFLGPYWKQLKDRVADVIMFMRDSTGLIPNDAGPWGPGLARTPNVYTSLHSIAALRIAARYARTMREETRAALYGQAAAEMLVAIERMIDRIQRQSSVQNLSPTELAVFHPLITDGITLGLFEPDGAAARFALDVVEKSYQIEDVADAYHAQPDGDWFGRQARPQLGLRLARAYAAMGNRNRAEKLFRDITTVASEHHGMIPELIDVVTKNWYGGLPAIGAGAAEYILTAEAIIQLRMR